MSNSKDKYATKDPHIKIDGERVHPDSAEWLAYWWKRRFFDFLLDLQNNPKKQNPLDSWDWDYMSQPDENYDLDDCIALLKKNKKAQSILKRWGYLGKPHSVYQ